MIYAGVSQQGKRERNEDSIFLPHKGEVSLAIVADGMGGHNAGLTASRIAVDSAAAVVKHGGGVTPAALLRKAAETANKAVFEKAQASRDCRGMGTTLVMALLFRSRYVAANIGDSRLYHFDGNSLRQITRDHSYVSEMVEAGYITPEEARTHPRRNIITRALGTREAEQVDLFENLWEEEDILMLCSDGLYGSLETKDMERVLREERDLQAACDTLAEIAAYGGSTDNISVVLVKNKEVR